MIDTCIGNDRQREFAVFCNLQTTFLEDLAAAGFPAESSRPTCCARTCTSTMWAGTRARSMASGCPPSRRRATCSAARNSSTGSTCATPTATTTWTPGRFHRSGGRSGPGRVHRAGLPPHRRGLADSHAGPHARSRQRAHRVPRPECGHHRRPDAQPDPDRRSPAPRRASTWTRNRARRRAANSCERFNDRHAGDRQSLLPIRPPAAHRAGRQGLETRRYEHGCHGDPA